MEINNKIIPLLDTSDLEKESLIIRNSVIGKIDLAFTEFEHTTLVLEECSIGEMFLHTTWFKDGFQLNNCVIKKSFNYEMGGHNQKPIIIKNNVFCDFANFFDAQFSELLVVENNIFCRATNLLIDFHTKTNNSFGTKTRINNNLGELNYETEF